MDITVLITLIVAFVMSIISAIAGGGAGLVITPYLILIGLPPQVAAATPKLAGIGLAGGSIRRFNRADLLDQVWVKALLPLGIIAGVVGPFILINLNEEVVKNIVLVTSLLLSLTFLGSKSGLAEVKPGKWQKRFGLFVYLVIAIAQAAFGSGIGGLLMFVLMGLLGIEALRANAIKRLVGLGILIPASVILFSQNLINISHGIALLIGMYLGGHIGAKIAISKGNSFVRGAFLMITVLTVLAAVIRT